MLCPYASRLLSHMSAVLLHIFFDTSAAAVSTKVHNVILAYRLMLTRISQLVGKISEQE